MQDNQSTSRSHGLKFIQLMKNRGLHTGIKRMVMLLGAGPSTTPIQREVFDSVEHKQ